LVDEAEPARAPAWIENKASKWQQAEKQQVVVIYVTHLRHPNSSLLLLVKGVS
jgi:hypothetical protein